MVELADLIRPGSGRGLDFGILGELRKRTGISASEILRFSVAELIANALDTDCTKIFVEARTVGMFDEVNVQDNGSKQISLEELELVLDFMGKAQRNAKRQVIPEAIIKAYLDYFMKLKEGKPAVAPSFEGLDLDQPPKEVKSEQVTVKEKPKARVGDPPRSTPPKITPEKPKEETPQGHPVSIEEVREKIAYFLPGHSELVVVSDRDDYYRIGRKRMLDKEIENHVNMIVATMGGAWDREANCWKIPKGVKD